MLRLLFDPPASGPWNMAVDEALLETAATTSQPTLRFYQWQEPTLSLGYFQELSDREQHRPSIDCCVVRRASGGGAILHDRELTYSLAVPEALGAHTRAPQLYDLCHKTLIAALGDFGVTAALYGRTMACGKKSDDCDTMPQSFLCFQRRTCFDVVLGQAKIAGSAQRRRRGAFLQHGSLLLARSQFAPELPGIEELVSQTIPLAEFAQAWASRLSEALKRPLIADNLSASELHRAAALAADRFGSPDRLGRR